MSRGIMETGSALARRNARGVTAVFRLYFVDFLFAFRGYMYTSRGWKSRAKGARQSAQ